MYGILQPGPDIKPGGVPYVRPTEIVNGEIALASVRHTSEEIATRYARSTLRAGDVLLTIVGTLGATAVVPAVLEGANITQSSCRIRTDPKLIDPRYLVLALHSTFMAEQIEKLQLGTAVRRLNIAHVRSLAIPLPPLEEQRRLVDKVSELMAVLDNLERRLSTAEANRGQLLEASLHEALTGAH